MSKASSTKQSIEELQERYDRFKAQKVKFETQRDAAREELEMLKQQARELYESDDVEQLEKMLEQMKAENETKRSQYQQSLDDIEQRLQQVEAEFTSNSQSGDA